MKNFLSVFALSLILSNYASAATAGDTGLHGSSVTTQPGGEGSAGVQIYQAQGTAIDKMAKIIGECKKQERIAELERSPGRLTHDVKEGMWASMYDIHSTKSSEPILELPAAKNLIVHRLNQRDAAGNLLKYDQLNENLKKAVDAYAEVFVKNFKSIRETAAWEFSPDVIKDDAGKDRNGYKSYLAKIPGVLASDKEDAKLMQTAESALIDWLKTCDKNEQSADFSSALAAVAKPVGAEAGKLPGNLSQNKALATALGNSETKAEDEAKIKELVATRDAAVAEAGSNTTDAKAAEAAFQKGVADSSMNGDVKTALLKAASHTASAKELIGSGENKGTIAKAKEEFSAQLVGIQSSEDAAKLSSDLKAKRDSLKKSSTSLGSEISVLEDHKKTRPLTKEEQSRLKALIKLKGDVDAELDPKNDSGFAKFEANAQRTLADRGKEINRRVGDPFSDKLTQNSQGYRESDKKIQALVDNEKAKVELDLAKAKLDQAVSDIPPSYDVDLDGIYSPSEIAAFQASDEEGEYARREAYKKAKEEHEKQLGFKSRSEKSVTDLNLSNQERSRLEVISKRMLTDENKVEEEREALTRSYSEQQSAVSKLEEELKTARGNLRSKRKDPFADVTAEEKIVKDLNADLKRERGVLSRQESQVQAPTTTQKERVVALSMADKAKTRPLIKAGVKATLDPAAVTELSIPDLNQVIAAFKSQKGKVKWEEYSTPEERKRVAQEIDAKIKALEDELNLKRIMLEELQ